MFLGLGSGNFDKESENHFKTNNPTAEDPLNDDNFFFEANYILGLGYDIFLKKFHGSLSFAAGLHFKMQDAMGGMVHFGPALRVKMNI
jgi:hypothetical protein